MQNDKLHRFVDIVEGISVETHVQYLLFLFKGKAQTILNFIGVLQKERNNVGNSSFIN